MVKSRSTNAGSKLAASAMGCGKCGESMAQCPCRHSSWKTTGIFRRLFSRKNFWILLVSSAVSRAFFPFPASLGLVTCPIPFFFLKNAFAFFSSKLPSSSSSAFGRSRQMHTICAPFSSRVLRERRSLVRFSGESFGFWYGNNFDLDWGRERLVIIGELSYSFLRRAQLLSVMPVVL